VDLERVPGSGRRSIGLPAPVVGFFQVSQDTVAIIENEQIRGFSGELCDEGTRPGFCGQIDPNDPIIPNLGNGIDVCALEMGA